MAITQRVEAVLFELQQYLQDEIPPNGAADAIATLMAQPPDVVMERVASWSVEQSRARSVPVSDLLLHALKKVYVTGEHKNAAKGIVAEGAVHPDLARYLRSIRPRHGGGLIDGNPVTGKPFVNIRTQWAHLIDLANAILSPEEQIAGRAEDMYVLRATGASMLAASGADPVLICQMMGDAQLETVRKHYFKSHIAHMQQAVNRVVVPTYEPVG